MAVLLILGASITFLHLGFYTLEETWLSSAVSPVVMSFFKHTLAISSCSSSNYALIFRPQWRYQVNHRYFWAVFGVIIGVFYVTDKEVAAISWGVLSWIPIQSLVWLLDDFLPEFQNSAYRFYLLIIVVLFVPSGCTQWYFLIFPLLNFYLIHAVNPCAAREIKTRVGIQMAIETSLCFVSGKNTMFFPVLVIFVSFLISSYGAVLFGFELCTSVFGESEDQSNYKELLPLAEKVKEKLIFKKKKLGKLIGFGIGMMGTVLFQNFFRLTSFNHVVAFLYLAVMWVANLAMLGVSEDLGVFNFLIGNVVVGCTVSQFGLRSTTWITYGACLLLYGLRLKLESFTLVYGHGGVARPERNMKSGEMGMKRELKSGFPLSVGNLNEEPEAQDPPEPKKLNEETEAQDPPEPRKLNEETEAQDPPEPNYLSEKTEAQVIPESNHLSGLSE